MDRFPDEFADLLTPFGRRVLAGRVDSACGLFRKSKDYFVVLPNVIEKKTARDCARLLDLHLRDHLVPLRNRIPPESISGMTRNYTEVLPKVMHSKTAYLKRKNAKSFQKAEQINLLQMMRSESFARFAEVVSGLRLYYESESQVICYEHGDYAGPHNDHHPETEGTRDGFIDFHVMFSNEAVDHHWLVYQKNWHLSEIVDINLQGAASVYKLPFWHYTTPLKAKRGRESEARRWLLLGTFNIAD